MIDIPKSLSDSVLAPSCNHWDWILNPGHFNINFKIPNGRDIWKIHLCGDCLPTEIWEYQSILVVSVLA